MIGGIEIATVIWRTADLTQSWSIDGQREDNRVRFLARNQAGEIIDQHFVGDGTQRRQHARASNDRTVRRFPYHSHVQKRIRLRAGASRTIVLWRNERVRQQEIVRPR